VRVSVRDTELSWPETLVSLGHVAVPFRPDDPAYGLESRQRPRRHAEHRLLAVSRRERRGHVSARLAHAPAQQSVLAADRSEVAAMVAADLARAAATAPAGGVAR
jgi:hypothetical protein